jgi:aminoglycoside phosphotransferase
VKASKVDALVKGTDFLPLRKIFGKEQLFWQVDDWLMENQNSIYIAVDEKNYSLLNKIEEKYGDILNQQLKIIKVRETRNILETLHISLKAVSQKEKINCLVVNLADTYIVDTPYIAGDFVYVSDYSEINNIWCYAEIVDNKILSYFEKPAYIENKRNLFTVIGRYVFSNFEKLVISVEKSLQSELSEMSQLLEVYAKSESIKPVYVRSEFWIDFGHESTAQIAQKNLQKSRFFNYVVLDGKNGRVEKVSEQFSKLKGEKYWYEEIPKYVSINVPKVLAFHANSKFARLEMSLLTGTPLSELLVNGNNPLEFWERIFYLLSIELGKFIQIEAPVGSYDLRKMYKDKTLQRLNMALSSDKWLNNLFTNSVIINGKRIPPLSSLLPKIDEELDSICRHEPNHVIHGDMCFGNILYDASNEELGFVDPRGSFGSEVPSVFGDLRYDLAKLRHSFISAYDYIVQGTIIFTPIKNDLEFEREVPRDYRQRLRIFEKFVTQLGYKMKDIELIELVLFLSMLPMHAEDSSRQEQLFLQALFLVGQYFQMYIPGALS